MTGHTAAMLSVCKSMLQIRSDYALAKALGVSKTTVSNYQAGKSHPDGDVCLKISEILCIPYSWILVMAQIDRTHGLERMAWQQVIEELSIKANAS